MSVECPYFTDNCCIKRVRSEGEPDQLTNFVARIAKELVYHDGNKSQTNLVIDGRLHDPERDEATHELVNPDGIPLPEINVPASDFAGLGWVAEKWGMSPIIFPAPAAERDLRTAIQMASKPERHHIFTHTGWTTIKKEPVYLTTSGGIGAKGLDRSITVQLPHELRHYDLPEPTADKAAFLDSLRLVNIGPPETTWPLLLATYRAAMGPSDFAVHLAGRTGTFKSELCSLMQSHFGEKMHGKALPASWNSTANALEALAYRAKDAIMVLDDFVPIGTAYQVRNLQKNADQIIRAQGNQAGRSRLTDVAAMQTTYYPRGVILSTGEDIPEGHSVRARMLILELVPGQITGGANAKLTQAQAKRSQYSKAMADWVMWLAGTNAYETMREASKTVRDKHIEIGHSRTPQILGDLLATLNLLVEYAVHMKFATMDQMLEVANKAEKAVLAAGSNQMQFLQAADPVEAVLDAIRLIMATNQAHARTRDGGTPEGAEKYGWTMEKKAGQMPSFVMHGPCLGWVEADENVFYLDVNMLPLLKKHAGGKLSVTQQTLLKRIKEAGVMVRNDQTRQENTTRVMAEGHRRRVLALDLTAVMDDED